MTFDIHNTIHSLDALFAAAAVFLSVGVVSLSVWCRIASRATGYKTGGDMTGKQALAHAAILIVGFGFMSLPYCWRAASVILTGWSA